MSIQGFTQNLGSSASLVLAAKLSRKNRKNTVS